MDNKIVMISIAAVIGIIVLGSVLMPILDDATATETTITNDGLYRMSYLDENSPEMVIEWDHTTPDKFTVNGEIITMNPTGSIPYSIICGGDNWFLRYTYISNANAAVDMIIATQSIQYTASVALGNDMTLTLAEGTAHIQLSNEESERTKPYDSCYCIDPNGQFVMKDPSKPAYLFGDSPIYITGRSVQNNKGCNITIDGTIADGVTITVVTDSDWIVSNENMVYSESKTYKDVFVFDKITFTVTTDDETPVELDLVYSQVVIPYQITAEFANHFTDGEIAIFAAIPVMIILAVLLGVVALVIRSRMD